MTRAFISLGGNVGPVEETLDRAIADLAAHPAIAVAAHSSWQRTKAVGAAAGADFLNGAAELRTELSAWELLELLFEIEDHHGRVRRGHWSPRTLDLDLLLYGEGIMDTPRLRVPHPACWYRRFVLDPLAEIAPEIRHPEKQASVSELRDRLLPRPLPVAVAGGESGFRRELIEQVGRMSHEVAVGEWRHDPFPGEPALLFWLGPGSETKRAAAEPGVRFEDLPALPRLDLSQAADANAAARDVLAAALG